MDNHDERKQEPEGPVFLSALRSAIAHPVAYGFYALGILALSAPAVLTTQRAYADLLGQTYASGSAVYNLDTNLRTDHGAAISQQADVLATLGGPLGLVAVFLGVFAAGGWIGVLLDRTDRGQARKFFAGGLHYFWRFTGLALFVILLLAAWHWVLFEWPYKELVLRRAFGLERADTRWMDSEATVLWLGWAQGGLHFLGLAAVFAWALYTRVRLALQPSNSVIVAGFAALWTLVRHPLRTLRPLVLLFLVELAVVSLALGAMSKALDSSLATHPDGWRVGLMALVAVLALLVSAVLFGARYAAATRVVRSFVKPLAHPDPWSDRIGPPGGPQYPLGGQDEFSVSM